MKKSITLKKRFSNISAIVLLATISTQQIAHGWAWTRKVCSATLEAEFGAPQDLDKCELNDGECAGDCKQIKLPKNTYPDYCTITLFAYVCVEKHKRSKGLVGKAPCILTSGNCHCPLGDPNLTVQWLPEGEYFSTSICETEAQS